MSALHYVGRLYSLDTLDTRFTTSSKSPPPHNDPPEQSADKTRSFPTKGKSNGEDLVDGASPSRWRTPEFLYHGLVFFVAVPLMFWTVYDVSKPSRTEYKKYSHLLSPGWIPGRMVDNSDQQYASFRNNLPYLFIVMTLHPLLRRVFETFYSPQSEAVPVVAPNKQTSGTHKDITRAGIDQRFNQRIVFDVGFGLAFLLALHGFSAVKVIVILYVNFTIATKLEMKYVPLATWIFNIGVLFANELGQGYPYGTVAKLFRPTSTEVQKPDNNWGTILDSYGGLIPRWEVLFNVTVLRLISFNMDFYWSISRAGASPIEKKQLDPANLSERDRVEISARIQDSSFRNYLAYALYSPLYLAGPILTFNDYISQQRYTPRSITRNRNIRYGIRFLVSLLVMEVMIHFIYVVAISKAQPAWEFYTPLQLSMLAFFNLHHIWLKLLLPWRFFRLWSLIDGIDPPENVVRCMSDNYSVFAFWRGWHRSFNRFLIRYIYIPLGGSGPPGSRGIWVQLRGLFNLLTIFTFVAVWHDIQLRLLIWGWLISLFVLPETIATLLFPKQKWKKHKDTYRVLCGIGAVGNILMMMSANLVGFAVGLDGFTGLVQGLLGSNSGLLFLVVACAALFTGVQVMFELREEEMRHGIKMKC